MVGSPKLKTVGMFFGLAVLLVGALAVFSVANGRLFTAPKSPAPIAAADDDADDADGERNLAGWEVKTGSWVQTTAGSNPNAQDWVKNHEIAVDDLDVIYFTHSAAVASSDSGAGYPNSDLAGEAKSNIRIKFTLDFLYDGLNDGKSETPLTNLKSKELFGDTADCVSTSEQASADWWVDEGWEVSGGTFPDFSAFDKSAAVHWGLKQAPASEDNNYLCRIVLEDVMKDNIKEFGKDITLVSGITVTPGGMKPTGDGTTAGLDPASGAARVIIKASSERMSVSAVSSVMVNDTGAAKADVRGCTAVGVYCHGAIGIGGSNDVFRYPPDHALTVSPTRTTGGEAGCPNDVSKCAEFEFNFEHSIVVTGGSAEKKQLWLYRVENLVYPAQSGFFYEIGGCFGGSGHQIKDPSEQWRAIVLKSEEVYDVVTGQAGESTPLCIAQAGIKNNPIKRGAWQSRLYLCRVSAEYKDEYGATESEVAKTGENCEDRVQSAKTNRNWDTVGNDGVLHTSNAIVVYDTAGTYSREVAPRW